MPAKEATIHYPRKGSGLSAIASARAGTRVGKHWPRIGFIALLVLASCGQPKPAAPPPPSVIVNQPVQHMVVDWDEYSGRLQSPETASIAARVSGLIVDSPFKEGALVKKGDVLFVIDDRPFKADLDNKRAAVAKDNAQLSLADIQLHRNAELLKTRVIAQQDYDTANATYEQAVAQLAADKAAEETSALNFEWTRVTAPFTGRISRMAVTTGNLVNGGGASQATQLTTLVSVDPVYCYVPVPERSYVTYQQVARQEKHTSLEDANISCFMQLENETDFGHAGTIDFIDNAVDPATGTIQLRGVFPNPNGLLKPGLFARLRIPGSVPYQALLVPDAAVGTQQDERFLLITGSNNIVESRPVKLGRLFGELRVISDGLKPGDKVIVDGLQKARPGAPVNPSEAPIPPEAMQALEASVAASPSPAPASSGSAAGTPAPDTTPGDAGGSPAPGHTPP
ncbi:MAG: efflux RND transporter periplasmic adaptor subunit [Chthoniobacteraceae bacterium]